ncbi:WhiB family transcriptional regulator [Umezawaea tangerina]|uniref:Transcription factor WhiB n=1 Tax=Umezawaea tangerina TaxID=84725 RepID=A0A2T0TCE8_9PSEU|nr:WhiB family transcriptional regulator [Umezawaea tangerina]PRY43314.1 transcription factor WhiB [Umezawaea tangerina]
MTALVDPPRSVHYLDAGSAERIPREVPDWHERGACRAFPELDRREVIDASGRVLQPAFNAWHDARPGTAADLAARVICAGCPVRLACAIGALERGERWGIWGGLDYADRKDVAAAFGFPRPGDPPEHGTNSRRVKWGCVCVDCKAAHALYEAERRASSRARRGAALLVVADPPEQALSIGLDLNTYRRRTRRRAGRRR